MGSIKNMDVVTIRGEVSPGRQIGRTIGFPTANLHVIDTFHYAVSRGVYGVKVYYKDLLYYGMMNVGVRPTFDEKIKTISYEVHIFDFNEDIYGEQLDVSVEFYIRDEQKFTSLNQLIQHLGQDAETAKRFFNMETAM